MKRRRETNNKRKKNNTIPKALSLAAGYNSTRKRILNPNSGKIMRSLASVNRNLKQIVNLHPNLHPGAETNENRKRRLVGNIVFDSNRFGLNSEQPLRFKTNSQIPLESGKLARTMAPVSKRFLYISRMHPNL